MAFLQLGLFRACRDFKIGELLLPLCEQFVTNAGDGSLVDVALVFEIGSFTVALSEEAGADVVELGPFADQRFTLGTQFGGEDFLGDVLSDSRLRSFEFEQFNSVRFVELLLLPVKFGLANLSIGIGRRQRLLQPLPFRGDLAADFGQQTMSVGFQLFATFGDVGLLGAKLFEGRMLRADLLLDGRFTLPQDVLFGLQFLFGLLLPESQVASFVIELLKLINENLFAPVKLGESGSEIIDQLPGVRQHLVMPWGGSRVEFRRRDGCLAGIHRTFDRVESSDSAIRERHETRRRLPRAVVCVWPEVRSVGLCLFGHSGSPFPGK